MLGIEGIFVTACVFLTITTPWAGALVPDSLVCLHVEHAALWTHVPIAG